MLFAAYELLAYFSRHMRMVPGDNLATETPPGVGMGKNRYVAVGDIPEKQKNASFSREKASHEIATPKGIQLDQRW